MTITANVHVREDTSMSARYMPCTSGDFTSLRVGDATLFLRGDDVERLAGVLNDYIASRSDDRIAA